MSSESLRIASDFVYSVRACMLSVSLLIVRELTLCGGVRVSCESLLHASREFHRMRAYVPAVCLCVLTCRRVFMRRLRTYALSGNLQAAYICNLPPNAKTINCLAAYQGGLALTPTAQLSPRSTANNPSQTADTPQTSTLLTLFSPLPDW